MVILFVKNKNYYKHIKKTQFFKKKNFKIG